MYTISSSQKLCVVFGLIYFEMLKSIIYRSLLAALAENN